MQQGPASIKTLNENATNLNKDDVARYLGISKDKVNRMVCNREIRFFKVGPLVRFNLACIHEYLERQQVEAR